MSKQSLKVKSSHCRMGRDRFFVALEYLRMEVQWMVRDG